MKVGVDVGGTFTDAVLWDGRGLSTTKVPTTPAEQSEGVVAALQSLGAADARLLHGTTVATNAVLERSGARVALVTDEGFEDLIEIGRQDRPSLYDTARTRTPPLVPRALRFGVPGRGSPEAGGDTVVPEGLVGALEDAEVEAVAIATLHGHAAAAREERIAEALASLRDSVAVSLASQVIPEFREFERMSTTVLDAYLRPVVSRYLEHLDRSVGSLGLASSASVLRSSGGLMTVDAAARLPVATLLSGPAAGVVAAAALGRATGRDSIISFDMGGTSTDVCRVDDGRPSVLYERPIDGLPCRMPAVAVHTVGAGGGSVAWIDDGGALRVGPRSAGADPGPAAYGHGGVDATVTDANVSLGRISPDALPGAALRMDEVAAVAALRRLADSLAMSVEDTGLGIIDVVEAHMERAIRRVSVEEGTDPRGAFLVAFGGAGGLHASSLGRRLDMAGVIIPPFSGVFSALGLLLAPPRADASMSVVVDPGSLDGAVAQVMDRALLGLGPHDGEVTVEAAVDARYLGQSHETSVPYRVGEGWDRLVERFHEAHRARNGFAREADPVEVVTVRAEAVGVPSLTWEDLPEVRPGANPRVGTRAVLTREGEVDASVWHRPALGRGDEIAGPALIEEPGATTFLGAGERCTVTSDGSLEITW